MNIGKLAELLQRCQYKYKDLTSRDVNQALSYFKELGPKNETYTYPNGITKDLITLAGTIPVNYRGNRYNIPIQLYLADTHPYTPPICYVRPTSDMCINVSETVDNNGRIMLPFINDWQYPKSDLYMLINLLSIRFSEQTPLYARSANQPAVAATTTATATSNPPYPVDNTLYNRPMYPAASSQPMPPYTSDPSGNPYAANPYYPMPQPQSMSHLKAGQTRQAYGQPLPNAGMPITTNTNTAGPNPTPYMDDTIKPEFYRMSLISAVRDKIKIKYAESYDEKMAEIDSLKRVRNDLEQSQQNLNELIKDAEDECYHIKGMTGELKRKSAQLSEKINRIQHRDNANIEDAIVTTTPLYRQLLQLFADEMAIQDLIFYLSEGLTHKTVSLENFLKQVRFLTRKQFMLRATIGKAREKATLPF